MATVPWTSKIPHNEFSKVCMSGVPGGVGWAGLGSCGLGLLSSSLAAFIVYCQTQVPQRHIPTCDDRTLRNVCLADWYFSGRWFFLGRSNDSLSTSAQRIFHCCNRPRHPQAQRPHILGRSDFKDLKKQGLGTLSPRFGCTWDVERAIVRKASTPGRASALAGFSGA